MAVSPIEKFTGKLEDKLWEEFEKVNSLSNPIEIHDAYTNRMTDVEERYIRFDISSSGSIRKT